jgi:hypothetical protein
MKWFFLEFSHLTGLPVVFFISSLISQDYSAISMKYKHFLVSNISKNLLKYKNLPLRNAARRKDYAGVFLIIYDP